MEKNAIPDDGLLQTTEFKAYDNVIAVVLFLCFLIGLPGNCLALKYFIQNKKRNLSNCLYIIACCIDVCSSIIALPAAAGLWNGRNPGILGTPIICTTWYYSLMMLQLTSIFVVMLLSVSRAIVIVFPFFKVNKRAVLSSIVGYVVYQSAWNVSRYFDSGGASFYYIPAAYCLSLSKGALDTAFNIDFTICLAAPPFIVFSALLVVIFKFRGDNGISETSQRNNRQSSLTITFFAALFLFCNHPSFLNQTMYIYTNVQNHIYPGPIYSNNFMYFYSWIISTCFCTVLNAALNPVLYFWRMKNFRSWILRFF